MRIGIIPWVQAGNANATFTWGWAFGGSFYDPKTQKVTADNPGVVKAMEWMTSYAKKFDVTRVNAFSQVLAVATRTRSISARLGWSACTYLSSMTSSGPLRVSTMA